MEHIGTSPKSGSPAPAVRRRRPTFGILLIVVGLVLLVHQLFPALTSKIFWPLILIAAGAWLLWRVRRS